MECKFCGAQALDSGVFCPQCGKRIDGKKKCDSCNSLIDENSIYCTFCGTRVDGKSVCKKCGELYEGSFCPKCGAENQIVKGGLKKKEYFKNGSSGVYAKVEKILSPSLYLGAMLIFVICSFFIGVRICLANAIDVKMETFFFFGEIFDYLKIGFSQYEGYINYDILQSGMNAIYGICMAVLIINFVIQAVCAIVGGIFVGKDLYHGRQARAYKYALPSFISFFATALIVFGLNYCKTEISTIGSSVHMSAGSIVGIVLGLSLIIVALVLNLIKKGKKEFNAAWLKKHIPLITAIALSVVLCFLVLCNAYYIGRTQTESGIASAGQYMLEIMTLLITEEMAISLGAALNLSRVSFVVNLLTVLLCFALITCLLYALFTGKNLRKTNLILSIVTAVFAVANMIFAIIAGNAFMDAPLITHASAKAIGTPTIAPLVFALIVMAGVIVYYIFTKEKEEQAI